VIISIMWVWVWMQVWVCVSQNRTHTSASTSIMFDNMNSTSTDYTTNRSEGSSRVLKEAYRSGLSERVADGGDVTR